MSKVRGVLAGAAALASFAILAACSKSSPAPADQSASSAPAAAEAPVEASALGTTTQPGPGKLKLDIKAASGEAIYGDPADGKAVFNQCASCHSKDAGETRVGPTLHGIIGRHSGEVAGFHYSTANKTSGLVWTEQELFVYLANPQKTVPGTYMTYTGVKDPQKRADVIAYLQENAK